MSWKAEPDHIFGSLEGSSMLPTLKPGWRILFARTAPSRLRPGEVIGFLTANGARTCHRLVCKIPLGVTVLLFQKGDGSKTICRLPQKQLLGKALFALDEHNRPVPIDRIEPTRLETLGYLFRWAWSALRRYPQSVPHRIP